MFAESDLIDVYTRKQAIEDGEQVLLENASGALAKDIYKYPVYLTSRIVALIDRAVAHPKHHNDYLGVLWDILYMSAKTGQRLDRQTTRFQVIITGTGRRKYHTMLAQCGPIDIDNPSPAITIMLSEEQQNVS